MGIEYRIRFPANPADLDRDLRGVRFFSDFDTQHRLYNLRSDPAATEGMPIAWVGIESDGLYLCENGGHTAESAMIFRSIIDLALKRSEKIEIEEI